jgi:hypothetical protein
VARCSGKMQWTKQSRRKGARADEHDNFEKDVVIDGAGSRELREEVEEVVAPHEGGEVELGNTEVGEAAENFDEEVRSHQVILEKKDALLDVWGEAPLELWVFDLYLA